MSQVTRVTILTIQRHECEMRQVIEKSIIPFFSYRANRVQLRRIKATTLTHQLPYDKNVWQIVVPLFWELNQDKQNSIYHFICWRDRRFEKLHTQKSKKYNQFWHNFWENIIALFCSASSKKIYVQFLGKNGDKDTWLKAMLRWHLEKKLCIVIFWIMIMYTV